MEIRTFQIVGTIAVMVAFVGIVVCLVFWVYVPKFKQKRRERVEKRTRERRAEELRELQERWDRKVDTYPVHQMIQEEFDLLPTKADAVTGEFLKRAPVGTWFVYQSAIGLSDVTVLGQIVEIDDLLVDQSGAATSPMPPLFNKYRLELIGETQTVSA